MALSENREELSRLAAFAHFGRLVWRAHYHLGERKDLSRGEIEALAQVAGIAIPVFQLEECDRECACIRNMNGLPVECLAPAFPENHQA